MKSKILLPTIGLVAVILFSITLYNLRRNPTSVFLYGTSIGNIKLSGLEFETGKNILNAAFGKPVYLNFEDSSRAVTLNDIGISYDETALFSLTETCRFSFPKMFCKGNGNAEVAKTKILKISEKTLDAYLNQLENEYQFINKNTIISFENYSFRVPSDEAKVKIDRKIFTTGNIAKQINAHNIKIKLTLDTVDELSTQKSLTSDLVDNMIKPLLIKYGGTPVSIPSDELKKFIETNESDGNYYGYISERAVSDYLNKLHKEYKSEDIAVLHEDAVRAIRLTMLYRATDYKINNAVILPLQGKPKTDGSKHDVYLEIVKSQQRLYRFEKGKLAKTYVISTGLTWDTPSGNFSVLGKQKMTISYFGNWYMPDYLPIGLIGGSYRFGFHAIPYHMDGAGNIYSRDPNTMGSPATGGCIQLQPEEATELFDWATVGTPVYIYE